MSYKYYFKKKVSEGGSLPDRPILINVYQSPKYIFKAECNVSGEAWYDRKLSIEEIIKYELIPDHALHTYSTQKPIHMIQCPMCKEPVDLAQGQCHRCGYIFQVRE